MEASGVFFEFGSRQNREEMPAYNHGMLPFQHMTIILIYELQLIMVSEDACR